MKLYVGLIALAGTLFLLMVWSVQHSREAAFERLETYKAQRTSVSAR